LLFPDQQDAVSFFSSDSDFSGCLFEATAYGTAFLFWDEFATWCAYQVLTIILSIVSYQAKSMYEI
jgi:hypothetical protein